ncbi:MAG: DUF503 domain-containing protein [Chloroflexi bacterium]|nr:DUF503 domain-containing protein [Chloroflexota bacterium]
MLIGACKVSLHLPTNHSLKGKRRILKSIITRAQRRFNVSIAEVDEQDLWQLATLGVSCVGSEAPHVNEVLSKVIDFIQDCRLEAEVTDCEIEILSACC